MPRLIDGNWCGYGRYVLDREHHSQYRCVYQPARELCPTGLKLCSKGLKAQCNLLPWVPGL